ncbi:hypothetical protein COB72_08205 [bacterium]|nr:MAG: hypothetical protein COB72_08205 [bacterium]
MGNQSTGKRSTKKPSKPEGADEVDNREPRTIERSEEDHDEPIDGFVWVAKREDNQHETESDARIEGDRSFTGI